MASMKDSGESLGRVQPNAKSLESKESDSRRILANGRAAGWFGKLRRLKPEGPGMTGRRVKDRPNRLARPRPLALRPKGPRRKGRETPLKGEEPGATSQDWIPTASERALRPDYTPAGGGQNPRKTDALFQPTRGKIRQTNDPLDWENEGSQHGPASAA